MGRTMSCVITGGPCSGKTSFMSVAQQMLSDLGWDVYLVGESATELHEKGVRWKDAFARGGMRSIAFYEAEFAKDFFEEFRRMSRCAKFEGRNAVILADRSPVDIRAYLPEGQDGDFMYARILKQAGIPSVLRALDIMDCVIKLTTAALGAEACFTLANNAARSETLEEAAYLDMRIEGAYAGHSCFSVIDNSTRFQEKIDRAFRQLCHFLGTPGFRQVERKFLVRAPVLTEFPIAFRKIAIEQHYLIAPQGEERKVRRRILGGASTHHFTAKRRGGRGEVVKTERIISEHEYRSLLELRDPAAAPIIKDRYCFLWEGNYFKLDAFGNFPGMCLLEVDSLSAAEEVSIPPFLKAEREVTGNKSYLNRTLAEFLAAGKLLS